MNQERLKELSQAYLNDMAGALSSATAYIGDTLGLYKAMANANPMTPADLASKTGLSERMVREWLIHQAASKYVEYDDSTGEDCYFLSPEQAYLLADPNSEQRLAGGFQFATALMKAHDQIVAAFKHGKGFPWDGHDHGVFEGVARFFEPVYAYQLIGSWIPKIPRLVERLNEGAKVADIGCGYGHSTIAMAKAFKKSMFFGYDYHEPSVEQCRQIAKGQTLSNIEFAACTAESYPDKQYDIITMFNCLHDIGRYNEAARHAFHCLTPGGILFLMEPMGGKKVADNFNDVGRLMAGSSVLCCTPHGVATGGDGLGTIVTDSRLSEILSKAGFKDFNRVGETRFNRLFVAYKEPQ